MYCDKRFCKGEVAMFITNRYALGAYQKEHRLWQGIPGIEKTKKGRLFITFYSGGETEAPGNYVVLKKAMTTVLPGAIFLRLTRLNFPRVPLIPAYGSIRWEDCGGFGLSRKRGNLTA